MPNIPLGVPTAARMYDEALGGKDNFEVDRAANAKLYEAVGEHRIRSTALENRRCLGRAVKYLAQECGVRQFLDLGSGLPSARNTHQIAQEADPAAKVVYVDIDPIVAAFRERQAPGSYVTIAHLTTDGMSDDEQQGGQAGFANSTAPLVLRTAQEIRELFADYELVEPGIVRPHEWHPDEDGSPPAPPRSSPAWAGSVTGRGFDHWISSAVE